MDSKILIFCEKRIYFELERNFKKTEKNSDNVKLINDQIFSSKSNERFMNNEMMKIMRHLLESDIVIFSDYKWFHYSVLYGMKPYGYIFPLKNRKRRFDQDLLDDSETNQEKYEDYEKIRQYHGHAFNLLNKKVHVFSLNFTKDGHKFKDLQRFISNIVIMNRIKRKQQESILESNDKFIYLNKIISTLNIKSQETKTDSVNSINIGLIKDINRLSDTLNRIIKYPFTITVVNSDKKTYLYVNGKDENNKRKSCHFECPWLGFYCSFREQERTRVYSEIPVIMNAIEIDGNTKKFLEFNEKPSELRDMNQDEILCFFNYSYFENQEIKKNFFKKPSERVIKFWNCNGAMIECLRTLKLRIFGKDFDEEKETNLEIKFLYVMSIDISKLSYCQFSHKLKDVLINTDNLEIKETDLKNFVESISSLDPDIIIGLGLSKLSNEGFQDITNFLIKDETNTYYKRGLWNCDEFLLKNHRLSHDEIINKNLNINQLVKLTHNKFTMLEIFTRMDMGFCSLSEDKISDNQHFMRYYLNILSSHIDNNVLISQAHDNIRDDIKGLDEKGGMVFNNLTNSQGNHKDVTCVDMNQYYPYIFVKLEINPGLKDVFRNMMISRIEKRGLIKKRLSEEKDSIDEKTREYLSNKQLIIKLFSNTMLGLMMHIFPSIYLKITETGREIISQFAEYLIPNYKLIYGHTDSIFFKKRDLNNQFDDKAFIKAFFDLDNSQLKYEMENFEDFYYYKGNMYFYIKGGKIHGKSLIHKSKGFPIFFENLIDKIMDFWFVRNERDIELIKNIICNQIKELLNMKPKRLAQQMSIYQLRHPSKVDVYIDRKTNDKNIAMLERMICRNEDIPDINQPLNRLVVYLRGRDTESFYESCEEYIKNYKMYDLDWNYYLDSKLFNLLCELIPELTEKREDMKRIILIMIDNS